MYVAEETGLSITLLETLKISFITYNLLIFKDTTQTNT